MRSKSLIYSLSKYFFFSGHILKIWFDFTRLHVNSVYTHTNSCFTLTNTITSCVSILSAFVSMALVVIPVQQQGNKAELIQLITCKQMTKCVMINPLLRGPQAGFITADFEVADKTDFDFKRVSVYF